LNAALQRETEKSKGGKGEEVKVFYSYFLRPKPQERARKSNFLKKRKQIKSTGVGCKSKVVKGVTRKNIRAWT